jgi:hypothetical protein
VSIGDGTHNKKLTARADLQYKGVTPITKNIIVLDEFGNEYGTTYLKRAKGLVKHGRARFIDDTRICLTRPPDNINLSEDETMNENINTNAEVQNGANTVTAADILLRIDKIIADTAHLKDTLDAWKVASENKEGIIGMPSVVLARETTNQRLIEFLQKMWDDISPKHDQKLIAFRVAADTIKTIEGVSGFDDRPSAIANLAKAMFADEKVTGDPAPKKQPKNTHTYGGGGTDKNGNPFSFSGNGGINGIINSAMSKANSIMNGVGDEED